MDELIEDALDNPLLKGITFSGEILLKELKNLLIWQKLLRKLALIFGAIQDILLRMY